MPLITIMPCLDMKNGRVVKGVHFTDLKDAGFSTDATINLPNGSRLSTQLVGCSAQGEDIETSFYRGFGRQAQLYNYQVNATTIDTGFRDNVNPVGFILMMIAVRLMQTEGMKSGSGNI